MTTKPKEQLHDCPKCGRTNFTKAGLRTHACKSAALAAPNSDLTECIARFKALQQIMKASIMGAKLIKYFLGLEVARLYDLHAELHGETRGGDHSKEQNGARAVLLEPWLESHLGVTARTCRRYHDFFESITTSDAQAATVKRLNGFWLEKRGELMKMPQLTAGKNNAPELSLQALGSVSATDLQTILDHPDEWGLHELFETPLKDVTPDADLEGDTSSASNKHKLAKFWLQDFSRRAMNNEFLKLPKREKEALLTTLEEATGTLKQHLKQGGKK